MKVKNDILSYNYEIEHLNYHNYEIKSYNDDVKAQNYEILK